MNPTQTPEAMHNSPEADFASALKLSIETGIPISPKIAQQMIDYFHATIGGGDIQPDKQSDITPPASPVQQTQNKNPTLPNTAIKREEPVVYNKEFDVTEIEKTAKRFADALEKKRLDPWDYSTELQAAYKAFTLMYSEQNYTQLHKIIGTNASGSGLIQFAHAKDIVTNAIPTDDAYREKILNAIYTAFSRDNRLTPSLVANGPLAAIDFFKTVPLNEVKSAFIVDFCRDFGVGIDYLRQALENGSVLLDARTGAKMDVTDTSKKTLAFIMNTYASLWVAQVGAVLGTAPCTGEEDNKLIFERISDGVHPLITLVDDPIPAFMPAIQAAFERTRTELDLPSN